MSFHSLLNNRCNIERLTETKDTMGGSVNTWATLYSGVLCRIQPVSGRETIEWAKYAVRVTHKMFCETDKSFTEKDRVLFDGRYFDIRVIRNIDEMGHHLEVLLEEVDKGTA